MTDEEVECANCEIKRPPDHISIQLKPEQVYFQAREEVREAIQFWLPSFPIVLCTLVIEYCWDSVFPTEEHCPNSLLSYERNRYLCQTCVGENQEVRQRKRLAELALYKTEDNKRFKGYSTVCSHGRHSSEEDRVFIHTLYKN